VAQLEKTEPLPVCVDADVLIAGLLSRTGASHAILVLGELGLLRLVVPEAAVEEVRRNLTAKLPDSVPLFEEFSPCGPPPGVPSDPARPRAGARTCRHKGRADPRCGDRRGSAPACHAQRQTLPLGAGSACGPPADARRGSPRVDGIARNVRTPEAAQWPAVSSRRQRDALVRGSPRARRR
jgi:hypothetical protein